MKKLLIICLSLSICFMSLLGLISARAASNESLANRRVAETPAAGTLTAEISANNTGSSIIADSGIGQAEKPLPGDSMPKEEPLPQDEPPTEPDNIKLIALTFDDGPSIEYTPILLDGLRERGVLVTFFMVGARAEKAPEIVQRIYEEGHAIGGHSYDHNNRLTKLNTAELDWQINGTAAIIAGITGGQEPFLLRPPYGAINEAVALKTGKANMMWNIDPRDWDVRDAEKVRQHIVENAIEGGVVILHDIVASTAEGALAAIDELQPQGWVFVTLPELYAAYDIPLEAGGIYRGPESYIKPK